MLILTFLIWQHSGNDFPYAADESWYVKAEKIKIIDFTQLMLRVNKGSTQLNLAENIDSTQQKLTGNTDESERRGSDLYAVYVWAASILDFHSFPVVIYSN